MILKSFEALQSHLVSSILQTDEEEQICFDQMKGKVDREYKILLLFSIQFHEKVELLVRKISLQPDNGTPIDLETGTKGDLVHPDISS